MARSAWAPARSTAAKRWRQRRHDADRALRGRAYRVRSAPGRLGPALHPGSAGGRPVPVRPGLLPRQQYRWCTGSMSLLGSRKFWATRMRWRTRCCYLSGFCYYVHTALFTFVAPAIPLVMLILHTGAGSADQLHVHRPVDDLQPGRLPCLAPLPVRARGAHDQAVVRVGPPVRPLGYLPTRSAWAGSPPAVVSGRPGHAASGWRDGLERRHRTGLGDAGGMAHDPVRPGLYPFARHRPARLRHHRDGTWRAPQPCPGHTEGGA